MEVTRDNFQSVLPDITACIDKCSFFAIDFEFTGLHASLDSVDAPNSFDDIQDRYSKLRSTAADFLPIQFGLSLFTAAGESEYDVSSYNFFLFPSEGRYGARNKLFKMELSCMNFLANNGMDFNKVFREGVPYILPREEMYARDSIERDQRREQTRPKRDNIVIRDSRDISFMAFSISVVQEWLRKDPSEDDVLHLDPCNAFRRRLLYQELEAKFGEKLLLQGEKDPEPHVTVRLVTPEQRVKRGQMEVQEKLDAVEKAVGFRKVVDALVSSKKLMVGHNMFLDILYLFHHFVDPLPEQCVDFKVRVHELFPRLLDTKFFAASCPIFENAFQNTSLLNLFKSVTTAPYGQLSWHFDTTSSQYEDGSESLHEAGFDSYITGCIYLELANRYMKHRDVKGEEAFPHMHHTLDVFMNRFFLMRSNVLFNITCLENVAPDTSDVFHVSKFDESVKTGDVKEWFPPASRVTWVDNTSCLVQVPRHAIDQVEEGTFSDRVIRSYSEVKYGRKRPRDEELEEGEVDESRSKRQKVSHEEDEGEQSSSNCVIS